MTPAANRYDAIIIGGGHNGLVCAAYLGSAGQRVLVLEAAAAPGGAAANVEFSPGFTVSGCAHILNMLDPKVSRDLNLASHGLKLSLPNLKTIALAEDGRHITFDGALATNDSLQVYSKTDKANLADLRRLLLRIGKLLKDFYGTVPPRLGTESWSDRIALAKLGWAIRRLGRNDMREMLRIAGCNIADVLNDELESDLLKGAIGFDAVLGTELGPRSPNSVFSLLHRLTGEANGIPGALALPEGGMGAVTRAMAAAAEAAGADIRTGSPVARILVENDRAMGVALETGEVIHADIVVSNADPKTTYLKLLGPQYLDTGFVRRVKNIRTRGTAAKLHLALDGLPEFTGLDAKELGQRLLIAPSLDYVERAFNHCKYGEYSTAPAIEMIIPTVNDAALAPQGKHILSAVVQYAPYELKGGWENARDEFIDTAIKTISAYAPGLEGRIIARELLTPRDIEEKYRMPGGHWHHGELALDQLYMMRPVPGAAQYAAPLPGLYTCGAGGHPGGGVMGIAGKNAADRILKDGKSR
ncbi:MAG: NAD(P)/FAD-dependent oxidoreductase [Rhodospirillaceae bacterium]|nr:NAD(P)/FAD-dependent oxidoreductase [Rhodospirillaceae bacterium]